MGYLKENTMQDDLKPQWSDGSEYVRENPTMGEHQAVCSQIHNIGHQLYQGKPSISPKVVILFELDQKMAEGKFAGNQMLTSKEFAMYFGKDNDLRKFVSDWRGQPLTDDEAKDFSLSKLIGKPCTLIIVHNTGKNGKVYANIAGIAKAKKDAPVVAVTHTDIPEWIEKKKAAQVAAPVKAGATISAPPPDDSDLPF